MSMLRRMNYVGIGYDVHPFEAGRDCYLGGVKIDHDQGLKGHSDADVLIHAIADALLGAIGEGDIGVHFPNDDDRWKGARSLVFLEAISDMIQERGGTIINVDGTVIAEAPKVVPHLQAMREAMGKALQIEPRRINVKATTNEKLGFIGRNEGISAMATASVDLPE